MAKKTAEKSKAHPDANELANELADQVRQSAHLIWRAGLGAFSRAEKEGGKLFDDLTQAGIDVEKQMFGANARADFVRTMACIADALGRRGIASLEQFERMFEQRIGRALVRSGIASDDDIDKLSSEVAQLERLVARLQHFAASDAATPTVLPGAKPAAATQNADAQRGSPV